MSVLIQIFLAVLTVWLIMKIRKRFKGRDGIK